MDETVKTRVDWGKTTPPVAVVETVASALDRTELELDPLAESIDPEALADVVRSPGVDHVTFGYEGCRVTLHIDGRLVVERPG